MSWCKPTWTNWVKSSSFASSSFPQRCKTHLALLPSLYGPEFGLGRHTLSLKRLLHIYRGKFFMVLESGEYLLRAPEYLWILNLLLWYIGTVKNSMIWFQWPPADWHQLLLHLLPAKGAKGRGRQKVKERWRMIEVVEVIEGGKINRNLRNFHEHHELPSNIHPNFLISHLDQLLSAKIFGSSQLSLQYLMQHDMVSLNWELVRCYGVTIFHVPLAIFYGSFQYLSLCCLVPFPSISWFSDSAGLCLFEPSLINQSAGRVEAQLIGGLQGFLKPKRFKALFESENSSHGLISGHDRHGLDSARLAIKNRSGIKFP